ncbi:MAG TPA: UDP-3-O-(3-hydroxymyristoyl)glucosamine N-acyltransferase [Thermodesulfobacteriota bacterium]|nr:UDP-3-O-(3-hydroxymyristoyl)glucosamine N-acyltransferase [Thermodesulfobacteriota bacterium]
MAFKFTLSEIANAIGGEVRGDASVEIGGIAGLEEAKRGDIAFLSNPKYEKFLDTTRASAVIVSLKTKTAEGKNFVAVKDPYLAFAKALTLLKPVIRFQQGISAKADIHASVKLGKDVSVGAFVVLEEGAEVGDGCVIYPGVYIGRGSIVGDGSVIYSNVSVREGVRLGKRVIIHCNSVIGSDGFGYVKEGVSYTKIPQTGGVIIGDDVEIGASVTIDRATLGQTVIGRGTKIDNLAQLAHNVKIGEDTVIVAQAGISGSTKVGSRVTLAGQTGVAGHIEITDDVMIGAKSGVTNDIKEKGVYTGYPVVPHMEWLRAQAAFGKLPELLKRVRELEKKLEETEKKKG